MRQKSTSHTKRRAKTPGRGDKKAVKHVLYPLSYGPVDSGADGIRTRNHVVCSDVVPPGIRRGRFRDGDKFGERFRACARAGFEPAHLSV